MIDRERAIELVAQGMVEAYSSNDSPRAPDIEEATKIVDALLALSDPLVSDLEHRLRVLAEAAVEDEQEIERLKAVEEAAKGLIQASDLWADQFNRGPEQPSLAPIWDEVAKLRAAING